MGYQTKLDLMPYLGKDVMVRTFGEELYIGSELEAVPYETDSGQMGYSAIRFQESRFTTPTTVRLVNIHQIALITNLVTLKYASG
jgi:hypothetical protein